MSTNLVVSSFMCDLFFPTKRSVVVGNVTVQQMQTSVLFSCHKHEPLVMVTGPLLSAGWCTFFLSLRFIDFESERPKWWLGFFSSWLGCDQNVAEGDKLQSVFQTGQDFVYCWDWMMLPLVSTYSKISSQELCEFQIKEVLLYFKVI